MSNVNNGGPAFPPFHDPKNHASGMTLRDWFAGQALAGLLAYPSDENPSHMPYAAYKLADAMLKARQTDQ